MDNLIIRATLSSDIPHIAKILSTSDAWTCYGITYEIAKQLLETMPDDSFVAVIDNDIVGFITLRIDGVGNIGSYIRMVVVAEPYRGKSIGSKLVEYISNIAFQKTQNLFLICSEGNDMARRFYEKIGFTQVGVLTDLVVKGHHEILYRKTTGPIKK